jgi:protocatechuate 3,4-dioxygenase beta subunit
MRILMSVAALFLLAACLASPANPIPMSQSTSANVGTSPLAIVPATKIQPTVPGIAATTTLTTTSRAGQSKAGMTGKVLSTTLGGRPLSQTPVRLGRIYWNADKTDGAYVFEGGTSPSAVTSADGTFAFENIEPGDYAIAVGDLMGNSVLIRGANQKARIITLVSDQVIDVGTLQVALP